jgi:NAD(P)H-nitrite reductase large subunit
MNKDDYVCICHKVPMGKLQSYIEREDPQVASLLSECLGAGTGCGWCVPFLEKLHRQHQAGETMNLGVDFNRYFERRDAYKGRSCKHENSDG